MEFDVLFKVCFICFLKTFAKIVYRKGFDKKQFIKKLFDKLSCIFGLKQNNLKTNNHFLAV